MPFSDPDNTTVTNPDTANQPSAGSPPAPAAPAPATPVPVQPSAAGAPVQPQPNAQQQMVSNPSAAQPQTLQPRQTPQPQTPKTPQPQPQQYPHASRVRDVAQILAGGPQVRTTVNPDGSRTVTRVPLSKSQIGMAIALEAISGALGGLAAGRGRGPGAAFLGGEQQGMQLAQQRRQIDQQQADQQSKALALKANIYETNSRTLLNTAESEKYGSEAIDKAVAINRASGVLDVSPGNLENSGEPMTQAELLDAMHSGKVNITSHLGPIAGRVEVTNPDGTKRWEATHLIIKDPNTPVSLTQDDWDRYATGKVKGYPAGVKIGTQTEIPLRMKQSANEQLQAHSLANYRLKDMRDTLARTQYADKVPASIDFSQPGVDSALTRFQKYVSHSNVHGMDVFESLQQMGADRRDPKTGEMQPNPDAKYVDTVAQALGGWPVLEAVHNQLAANKKSTEDFAVIDSEAKANAVLASPKRFTQEQAQSARQFLVLSEQQGGKKAAAESKARQPYEQDRGGVVTPEDADAIADAIIQGKQPPVIKNLYRNTAKVQAAIAKKGYDLARAQTDWNATQKRLATMNGSQQVRLQQAVEFASESLPLLKQHYEDWKQAAGVSGFKVFNRAALSTMKSLPGKSGAAAQALETQIADMTSELGTVYKGGNSSTDESLALAAKNFSSDWNEETFDRAYDLVQQNLRIRRNSIQLSVNPIGVSSNSPYPPYGQQNPASTQQQSPPISLLKEGVRTSFANGQTWTLQNGQPVQVQN